MAITMDKPTVPMIIYHWENVCKQDSSVLEKELKGTSTPRIKSLTKLLGIKMGEDKNKTINLLIEEIKKLKKENEEMSTEEVKVEEKVVEENNIPPVMQIKIKPEYLSLVPRPSKEQYEIIKNSIQKNGMEKKIEVLDDGTIIDGHTRFTILQELNMLPVPADKIKILTFENEEAILNYIFNINVARRQLSDLGKLEWASKFMPIIEKVKEDAKKKKAEKISDVKTGKKEKQAKPERTREKVAKLAGVTPAQQQRYDFINKWAPELLEEAKKDNKSLGAIYHRAAEMRKYVESKMPEVLDQILNKQITLTEAYSQVQEKFPEEEKKPGPIGQVVKNIKDLYWKILIKKYGENVASDEFETEMINRLDAMFDKYLDSGK